jgi:hypothetical protein
MPIYAFRCDGDGDFEVTVPVGRAGTRQPCPICGLDGARVFVTPMVGRVDRRIGSALDRAERSRSEPEVVRSLPSDGGAARTEPSHPAWRRLPRP